MPRKAFTKLLIDTLHDRYGCNCNAPVTLETIRSQVNRKHGGAAAHAYQCQPS